MDAFANGQVQRVQVAQAGPLTQLPDLPAPDAASTGRWIESVLNGQQPVPEPIAIQVSHLVRMAQTPLCFITT